MQNRLMKTEGARPVGKRAHPRKAPPLSSLPFSRESGYSYDLFESHREGSIAFPGGISVEIFSLDLMPESRR